NGGEVLDALTAKALGQLGAFPAEGLFQLSLTLAQAFDEFRVLPVRFQVAHQGQGPFGRTIENSVKRVVVPGGDRVVFVIVTARATNSQTLGAAHDDIDAIVNDVVHHAKTTP